MNAAASTNIEVQVADAPDIDPLSLPSVGQFHAWAQAALRAAGADGNLCVRVVGEAEGRHLNAEYRGKDRATNVLAFPVSASVHTEKGLLGDIAICAPEVLKEVDNAGNATEVGDHDEARTRHWAHMVVHGVLHLLGYDHQTSDEAGRMESCEQAILNELGFAGAATNA